MTTTTPDMDEITSVRSTLRDFLQTHSSSAQVRAAEDGHDVELWDRVTGELGLAGILVPESLGGIGASATMAAAVIEETGAALTCTPLFGSSVLAVGLFRHAVGASRVDETLSAVAGGSMILAAAVAERDAGWADAPGVVGVPTEPGESDTAAWTLSGEKLFVVNGAQADRLVVTALAQGSVGVFLVDPRDPGVTVTAQTTMDHTRPQARVVLDRAPAVLLDELPDPAAAVRSAHTMGMLLLAAEQVGGTRWCLATTQSYVSTREQFGKPIGAFQAVRHQCVDLYVDLLAARSLVHAACRATDDGTADADWLVAAAATRASEAYLKAAWQTVHLHGGLGFTWEHDAHLHVRRAQSSAVLLGHPDQHREALLAMSET